MSRYSRSSRSSRYADSYYGFAPYVPVAQRRAKAAKETAKLAKAGKTITPVQITGRKIAASFWGKAWCDNLEAYSDYENRLPRGRTYVRNGSVVHLEIRSGEIEALVSGSELYKITVTITPVAKPKWQSLCKECAGGIGSLIELLQARLSDRVMAVITNRDNGLFPAPKEIKMRCSCPDSAGLCKHLAAVLYGVGSRLDQQPELLFKLRSVDSADLISHAADSGVLTSGVAAGPGLADGDLGAIFGIEMAAEATVAYPATTKKGAGKKPKKAPAKPAKEAAAKLMPPLARKAAVAKKSVAKSPSAARSQSNLREANNTSAALPAKKPAARKVKATKTSAKHGSRQMGKPSSASGLG